MLGKMLFVTSVVMVRIIMFMINMGDAAAWLMVKT